MLIFVYLLFANLFICAEATGGFPYLNVMVYYDSSLVTSNVPYQTGYDDVSVLVDDNFDTLSSLRTQTGLDPEVYPIWINIEIDIGVSHVREVLFITEKGCDTNGDCSFYPEGVELRVGFDPDPTIN